MLSIAWRFSIFSLTKSGRIKSRALRFVSRIRFRRPGELRSRRGRWASFLTERCYAFGNSVASSPQDEPVRPVDLTACQVRGSGCLARPLCNESRDKLFANRHQQFIYQARIRFTNGPRTEHSDRDA